MRGTAGPGSGYVHQGVTVHRGIRHAVGLPARLHTNKTATGHDPSHTRTASHSYYLQRLRAIHARLTLRLSEHQTTSLSSGSLRTGHGIRVKKSHQILQCPAW